MPLLKVNPDLGELDGVCTLDRIHELAAAIEGGVFERSSVPAQYVAGLVLDAVPIGHIVVHKLRDAVVEPPDRALEPGLLRAFPGLQEPAQGLLLGFPDLVGERRTDVSQPVLLTQPP